MIILEGPDGRQVLLADCWACGAAFEGHPETTAVILIDPATNLPPDVEIGEDRRLRLLTDRAVSAEDRERCVQMPICPDCKERGQAARRRLLAEDH